MYRLKQITLWVGDMFGLYIGLYSAIFLRYLRLPSQNLIELISPFTFLFFLAGIIMFISGLYDVTKLKNSWAFFQKVLISTVIWIILGITYFYINHNQSVAPKTILLLTALIGFCLLSLWRFLYNRFIAINLKYNIVFAGITAEVIELIQTIKNGPQTGYAVVGILARDESEKNKLLVPDSIKASIPFAKTMAEIQQQIKAPINIIVLAPQLSANQELLKDLYQGLFQQISIIGLSDFYESVMHRIPPFTFSETWFVTNLQEQQKKIYDRFRILTDYIVAFFITLFFLATFPFIALAIKLNSKGNIFFTQNRVGRQGNIFKVFKYRTMQSLSADGSAETSGPQFAAHHDNRITTVGKFLRLSRLDEIPQFINILKGEMSVIGPRPERPEFVDQLTSTMPFYALRHLIKPGLTGWAQINKSYYGTLEENLRKLEYDLFYLKNRNLTLDISIILRTINTIVRFAGR